MKKIKELAWIDDNIMVDIYQIFLNLLGHHIKHPLNLPFLPRIICSLYKILEQESHNLRLKENFFIFSVSGKIDIQLVFAQQIHIRATDLGENEMIQRSREYLQTNRRPFFNILWARIRDKSTLIRTLEGHTDSVLSVAVTPDGSKIVSGSNDTTIKVWELNNGANIFTCKFDSSIFTIAISKNKNIMTIGDSNSGVYTININDR